MTTLVRQLNRTRTIVGYCWPWTVRPGEGLDFMVSTESNGTKYRADLVRVICAESLSDPRLFKERDVPAPFAGSYEGRTQTTPIGSYVEIAPDRALDGLHSFTVQVMVMPTLLPEGARRRVGGAPLSIEEPVFQDQQLVSRWNHPGQRGWALLIDAAGRAAFICGDGQSIHRAVLPRALIQDQWFFLAASCDASNGAITVHARHIPRFASKASWPESLIETKHELRSGIPHEGPLRFAACVGGPGNGSRAKPAMCFSGRLDRVRLSAGTLSGPQALALAESTPPESPAAPLAGFWDFSKNMNSRDVRDLSENHLHGQTVNLPTRAVAGVSWDNSVTDWRQRLEHYSAIHFHDDDLYDAEWSSDFSYEVPQDLPSGIYAARLRDGNSEDYIPFFVAPPRGKANAKAALLIPTATYTAYANVVGLTIAARKRRIQGEDGELRIIEEDPASAILQDAADADFLLKNLRTLGKGIYANHTDVTLRAFASQKHPNMTIKPKGFQWTLVADTLITDWLEERGIACDIISDDLLHEEGVELLKRYTVVMTGNHPEYYSKAMLDAVVQYQEQGGRLMYLGGNGFYWVTSFNRRWPGAIEVRKDRLYSGNWKPYELHHAFDGAHGGLWDRNGRAPQALVGVGFVGSTGYALEGGAPYRRLPDSYNERVAFVFEGIASERFGDFGVLGGGAAGQEFDCVNAELGTPAHALHLARASEFKSHVNMLDKEYALNAPTPFGDVVYFETANGGAVFSAGSMGWVGSLCHDDYENDVARITENVLRRFLDAEPIAYPKEYASNGCAAGSEKTRS